MKLVVTADRRLSPKKEYVRQVLEAMDWRNPTFCDATANGYRLKWGGLSRVGHKLREFSETYGPLNNLPPEQLASLKEQAWRLAEDEVAEIRERTGIDCTLTRSGNLVVPYYKGDV